MVKKAQSAGIIIFFVVLIVLFLITSNTSIVYKTFEPKSVDLFCEDGIPKTRNDLMGFSSTIVHTEATTSCFHYKTSHYEFICEQDKVYVNCKATIWNIYVTKTPRSFY